VCKGRSNTCNPLVPWIDKNLGNPVVKKVQVRTLADRRWIHLLSVNTLRRFRPPQLRLLAEAPIVGEVDGLCIDDERATSGGFRCRPVTPAVITYPGRQSPRRSCVPRRWRGPKSNPGRRRGGGPERSSPQVGELEAHSPRAGPKACSP
jgi:hypothetical protein